MFLAQAAAQTTDNVSWGLIVTIISASTVFLGLVIGGVAKLLTDKITNAINQFRIDVVNQLDTRLTAVETKLNDIRSTQNRR